MSEPWLTKRELAALLRVSTRTVERLGIIPDLRVGGQNRYLRSSAEAQLAGAAPDGGEVVRFPRGRTRGAVG